jgi:hypothetical protein
MTRTVTRALGVDRNGRQPDELELVDEVVVSVDVIVMTTILKLPAASASAVSA